MQRFLFHFDRYSLHITSIKKPIIHLIKELLLFVGLPVVFFQISPKFVSGAFQDGEKDVNYIISWLQSLQVLVKIFTFQRTKWPKIIIKTKTFKRLPINIEKRSRGVNDNFLRQTFELICISLSTSNS